MVFVKEERFIHLFPSKMFIFFVPKFNLHLNSIKILRSMLQKSDFVCKSEYGFCLQACTHSKCLQRLDEAIRNPGTGVTDDCGLELISEMQF